MTKQLKITYKKTADLLPYANNSRTHSDEQIEQLARSIKEFGFTNPVLLDGQNGIIAGHGRVMAAEKLGEAEVPTIELSHLSKEQKRAYVIADNKLALNAGWDEQMLAFELGELKELGFDMSLLGFEQQELGSIFGRDDAETEELREYSKKIDTPIYSPKGDKPELSSLIDNSKAKALVAKIKESNVTDADKAFLMQAAFRHMVFDYHSIAEYYCHASKEMQELMEDSALVIIDFDKAIEGGYVAMSSRLKKIYLDSYGTLPNDGE
jgi:ParB-like nuclease domain